MAANDQSGRGSALGPGAILNLIRDTGQVTRSELLSLTGLGRSTIAQRVDALIASGLVTPVGEAPSTGGRPPATLVFDATSGLVLAADLGATHAHLALADLGATILAESKSEIAIAEGPETVLSWVEQGFQGLLEEAGRSVDDVGAIGVGVPGPVEHASGRPVSPPIMPGWDGYPIPARLSERFRVPVLVDNDVNVMALGEYATRGSDFEHMLFIKVSTGIGCGIVVGGEIYRGSDGAAGDIGHIRVPGHEDVICECGNTGCLEAVVGGRALAHRARELGFETETSRDVVALVRSHEREVVQLVREGGRLLGGVLAGLVNALNPDVIVIGGDLAEAHEQLFAGVREVVYQRSTPLAARHLRIAKCELGDRAGVSGAAVLAIEHVLAPETIDSALAPPG